MQKKKIYQLAAVIVLVVGVAAALILTGMRKSTPVSEAQASSVPSSALPGGEAEGPSSAAASSESAVSSEATGESPVSSFLEQLEEELGISSSETASSSEVSSAASASKADSVSSAVSGSNAAHSVPASSAASSSHAASSQAPSSHASGSSAASENEVDAKINSYIRRLERLQRQTESRLYAVICEAYDEYMSHPIEERNMGMKISIVLSKTAKLGSVQSECDQEFNAILKELRQYLRDNGRDQTVADDSEKAYKKMKSDLTSELTDIVYKSAVGSGDGGRWITEHRQYKT